MKDTVGFSVMYPVLNKTSLKMVASRTVETYESAGQMERFKRLKTVSPQNFRRDALDYMMINKTTYLNIL